MKLLLDSCISGFAAASLRANGHDVVWTCEWPADPGDEEILATAYAEERVLVTLDKDFGELVILHHANHHGILRIVNYSAKQQGLVCESILKDHGAELLAGAIITAEPERLRIRAADGG